MSTSILFVRNFPAAVCSSLALIQHHEAEHNLKLVGSWNIVRHLLQELDKGIDKIIVIDADCYRQTGENSVQELKKALRLNSGKFEIHWWHRKGSSIAQQLQDDRIQWHEFDKSTAVQEFRASVPPQNIQRWVEWSRADQLDGRQCPEAAYFQHLVVQQFRTLIPHDQEIFDLIKRWKSMILNPRKSEHQLTQAQKSLAEVHVEYGEWYLAGSPTGLVGDLIRRLNRYASDPGKCRVLIRGETGTGKELAAKHLHFCSPVATAPFVAVNCANFTEQMMISELFGHVRGAFTGAYSDHDGLIKKAEGGTLFLDEVADLNLDLQARLLRFLQEGTYTPLGSSKVERADVRVISATCKDLVELVRIGSFREDLYWRLAHAVVTMPSIHEMIEHQDPEGEYGVDLVHVVERLQREIAVQRQGQMAELSEDDWEAIWELKWSGNVRQLRAVLLSFQIENWQCDNPRSLREIYRDLGIYGEDAVDDVDDEEEQGGLIGYLGGSPVSVKDLVGAYAREVLDYSDGNKLLAMQALGVSRNTLVKYLKLSGDVPEISS